MPPYVTKDVCIIVDGATTIETVELCNLEVLYEGGVESKYGQDTDPTDGVLKPRNRHKIGMKRVRFTLRKWYKADATNTDQLYTLFDNDTEFSLIEYVKSIVGSFAGLQILECVAYNYNAETGTANDIIIEEIQGEGLSYEAYTPLIHYCEDLTLFTTFTDGIGGAEFNTIDKCSITAKVYQGGSTYAYYDYGANYFQDFTHAITFTVGASSDGSKFIFWMLADGIGDWNTLVTATNTAIAVEWYWKQSTLETYFVIRETIGGIEYSATSAILPWNSSYYLKIVKNGTNLTCFYYSDEARIVLIDSVTLVLQADHHLQYAYVVSSHNEGVVRTTNGTVSKFDLEWQNTVCTCQTDTTTTTTSTTTTTTTTTSTTTTTTTTTTTSTTTTTTSTTTTTPPCPDGEQIVNGGFETGDLTGWDYDGGTPAPVVSSTLPKSGTYKCIINGNEDVFNVIGDWITGLLVSCVDTFGFWYKNPSANADSGTVYIRDITDSNNTYVDFVLEANKTDWTYVDLKVLLGSPFIPSLYDPLHINRIIEIDFWDDNDSAVEIDDVSLVGTG